LQLLLEQNIAVLQAKMAELDEWLYNNENRIIPVEDIVVPADNLSQQ
jgi:hypothetical protein